MSSWCIILSELCVLRPNISLFSSISDTSPHLFPQRSPQMGSLQHSPGKMAASCLWRWLQSAQRLEPWLLISWLPSAPGWYSFRTYFGTTGTGFHNGNILPTALEGDRQLLGDSVSLGIRTTPCVPKLPKELEPWGVIPINEALKVSHSQLERRTTDLKSLSSNLTPFLLTSTLIFSNKFFWSSLEDKIQPKACIG